MEFSSASQALTTIPGTIAGCIGPTSRGQVLIGTSRGLGLREEQTNMFSIFHRTTHLGMVVGTRESLFLTRVGNIASDEELEIVSTRTSRGIAGVDVPWDGKQGAQA